MLENKISANVLSLLESAGHTVQDFAVTSGAHRKCEQIPRWQVLLLTKEQKQNGLSVYGEYDCWESMASFLKRAKKNGFSIDTQTMELWSN